MMRGKKIGGLDGVGEFLRIFEAEQDCMVVTAALLLDDGLVLARNFDDRKEKVC